MFQKNNKDVRSQIRNQSLGGNLPQKGKHSFYKEETTIGKLNGKEMSVLGKEGNIGRDS